MSAFRLLLASLAYHWRTHASVACGVAAGTAVLTGALLVGDSMRGSLRQLTLQRLGRIDQALVADRFFRAQLADELAARSEFPRQAAAVPAILLDVSLENPDGESAARANRVHLVGCDARFWQLGSGGPSRLPDSHQIVLNQPLADQLGVKAGDSILVRLPHPGSIPAEVPLGRKSETVRSRRLTVCEVIPPRGFGRFSLRAGQQAPRNAYMSLDGLQDDLDQPGRVNAILVGDAPESVQDLLSPRLEDYGIRVTRTRRGYINITSDRLLLEPAVEKAILAAQGDWSDFAADRSVHRESPPAAKLDLSPFIQPALTYLANTIACGRREIPYSTITAVDFCDTPPLGPMLAADGKPVAPLGDGQIVLNAWAAEDLQAKPGDAIQVRFFEPESTRGAVREQSVALRLAAVVPLSGAAADPDFTPEVPGVTDRLSISTWNPPFPFDSNRVRKKDEDYWKAHRGTPKAFVSLALGRKLWSSRFGQTTSLRVAQRAAPAGRSPAGDSAALDRARAAIHLDPADMGFVFRPVKAQGLAASAGTTPFEVLFLSFSFFLIVAAAMLVALLFRLGVDRRAAEIGILLAVGWRRRQVTSLLVGEGAGVAALGSLAGLALGIGYAALLIAGLHTLWLAAVVTPFLQLHMTWQSLGIGYVAGLLVALATVAWSAWRAGSGRPRRLLAGEVDTGDGRHVARSLRDRGGASRRDATTWSVRVMWIASAGAIGLAVAATRMGDEFQAGAFFGAASLVLAACLAFVWTRLASGATGAAVAPGRGNLLRLAVRNAARNPMRSTLTIGLVAAASFLIVSVSAFRIDPAREKPNLASGNGGFTIVAESDQPIYYDLNTPQGREQLGFSPEDSRALAATRTIPLRVRPGDDASCLNLYRPPQPRVLGVPRQFIERGGFAWASFAAPADGDPDARGSVSPRPTSASRSDATTWAAAVAENPWLLLERDLGPDEDGVPHVRVVLEKNTANYSLQLWEGVGQTYDIRDGSGQPLRLVILGLLGPSIFQGDLLISERAFLQHFPDESGYRFFLIETPTAEPASVQKVQRILERTLGDFGFTTETTGQRLAAFLAVQNTYLSTFQSLGGLGLLLGTFGLAAVQLRSVLERRGELALLRAVGFRRRLLAAMVTLENAMLLLAGLACGVLSAAVAVLPHFWSGSASIPWGSLAATLGLVLAVGLLAGLTAVRSALRSPLLAALRGD